jgi:hypothetical protein
MRASDRITDFSAGSREWERLRARRRTRNKATSVIMLAAITLISGFAVFILYLVYLMIAAAAQSMAPQMMPSLEEMAKPAAHAWRR